MGCQMRAVQGRGVIRLGKLLIGKDCIFQSRNLSSEAASATENPSLEERFHRIRELAKARFEKSTQQSAAQEPESSGKHERIKERPKVVKYNEFKGSATKKETQKKERKHPEVNGEPKKYEKAVSAPIDGKKYAEWGRDKFKLPKRDSSGLLLSKAARERIEKATVVGKAEKKKKSGTQSDSEVKGVKGTIVSCEDTEETTPFSCSVDMRFEGEKINGDDEVTSDQMETIKLSQSDIPTNSPADLLNFALKSLNSLKQTEDEECSRESNTEDPMESTISGQPVKEGWNASFRDRVEQALADKGLINNTVSSSINVNTRETSEEDDSEDDQEESMEEDILEEEEHIPEEEENIAEDEDGDVVEEFNSSKTGQSLDGAAQARALIAAVDDQTEGIGPLEHGEQKSLRVGIIGAPNAGKSSLLNYMIGTKVSAVSRKTNTTRNEILGVLTEDDTQILFYDTPGLMMGWKGQGIRRDVKSRVQSAWMVTGHCEVLIVLVDAHRQIERPDLRVRRLVEKLGQKKQDKQKRILCLNKVDLIRQKRELVPLAQEFGNLPGFDRVFMISGLRGGGVRHLKEYLMEEAVYRPWEEQKGVVTDMSPVMAAKEVVWEHVLDNVHQEIPYHLHHKHVSWKVLKDRSIRIEQQIVVPTENQKKILVGKNGTLIRKIGMAANEELSSRFGTKVHLILDVKVSHTENLYAEMENIPDEMWL